jgi:hypothetical protein
MNAAPPHIDRFKAVRLGSEQGGLIAFIHQKIIFNDAFERLNRQGDFLFSLGMLRVDQKNQPVILQAERSEPCIAPV